MILSDAGTPTTKTAPSDPHLHQQTQEVAKILSTLANPRRLMVLCHLMQEKEASVTELAEKVGLSQSALSQHLSIMRGEGLVRSRRAGLNIYYSIADPRIEKLVRSLEDIYCTA